MRGLDLQMILKTIGCPDTWITEVPIVTNHPIPPKPLSLPNQATSVPSVNIPTSSLHNEPMHQMKRPFKSISAEIGAIQPLNLNDALAARPLLADALQNRKRTASGLRGLFDDWDPTANLDSSGGASSSSVPVELEPLKPSAETENVLKTPKEEPKDETEQVNEPNESEIVTERERSMIDDLFRQQNVMERVRKSEDSESTNVNYVVTCNYPNCGLQYNWRIKYGKLRLLDHALTHSNRKIPCKLCGFECTNVSRMRSHYVKIHPNERMEGYGMKALVSGNDGDTNQQIDEEELKELWMTCYRDSIHFVGQAVGFGDGDKFRRLTKNRKMEREARNLQSYPYPS